MVDGPHAVRARQDVFLTTHYMDEAQALADRVAIMRGGQIIAIGSPDELGGRDQRPAEIRFVLPAGPLARGRPRLSPRASGCTMATAS